jgi:predicted Zn-dependent peptidase
MKRTIAGVLLWLLAPCLLAAQSLQDYEKKITEFTLPNGLHFIVFERHEAPVVSFHTYVNAASVDDPGGKTGLAHMFEHMAFKGTPTIGTKNYPEEKKALDAVEAAYDRLDAQRNLGVRSDAAKIKALEAELQAAIEKANSFVDSEAFTRIIEESGGVGLNAGTGEDSTDYFYSLPANRMELWFLLESSRFRFPIYREFYKERDVVREERRMRVESSPQGKLMESLLATAFAAHPYRNLPGGWGSDIENLRVGDAQRFFKSYYAPVNITIAIAGDVAQADVKRLAAKYFSALPGLPPPPGVVTVEPPQEGEKRAEVMSPSQPFLLIGYKRPDQRDTDDPVFDVLGAILSSGRTGLLYKEMVRDKKIALAAQAQSSFPGSKYPNLFLFFVAPSLGRTVAENEQACYEILERLKKEKVDDETLNRVKTKIRASVIRGLDSNSGMAEQLASYYVNYGDWRKLFTGIDDIRKVTADDVQRVVREYFTPASRTVVYTVIPKTPAAEGGK